jgi:hypothetical protein
MQNLLLMFLAILLASCAGTTVTTVNDQQDETARGIRYYPPAPYLLVYTDNEGGLTSRIIYLPDTSQKMSAHPYAILASNTTAFGFDETMGYLKGFSVDANAEEVPKAFVAALEQVASAAIKAAPAANVVEVNGVPAPHLFKIVVRGGEIQLLGGKSNPSVVSY